MTNGHLTVPGSSPEIQPAGVNGRARSGSTRSSRSGNSGGGVERVLPEDYARRPSIRIRRAYSNLPAAVLQQDVPGVGQNNENITIQEPGEQVRRSRSSSAPLRLHVPGSSTEAGGSELPDLAEERFSPTDEEPRDETGPIARDYARGASKLNEVPVLVNSPPVSSGWRPLRRARTNIGNSGEGTNPTVQGRDLNQREYDADLVDLLDLVDPEVATLSTLTNVQNSLFIPNLGKYLNRRPTYDLTRPETDSIGDTSSSEDGDESTEVPSRATARPGATRTATGATLNTLTSRVNEKYYAVLPHGVRLPGWTEEEKLELNDHVRHMLHSKRSKFKRGMKGFGQYFRTPLGAFVTIYATLITLFGLAWVLFLIGWINVGGRQSYLINIIDNVLVALFAIMGDGLAPFRTVDTYHMIFIAHYHHLTWRLRREQALPKLHNKNDLPAVQPEDLEAQMQQTEESKDDLDDKAEFSVLSPEQVKKLAHHQKKFAKSHSFYKPHETATHHAFPLRLLVAIVVLLDCHSLLQIALGTCTWAISYHVRPFALTTVILCCSITCNITAGVLITVGDHKTRKKDVREKMFRQELTAEAMKKMRKRTRKEMKKSGELQDGEELPEEGILQPLGKMHQLDSGEYGVDGEKRTNEELENGKKGKETVPFPNLDESPAQSIKE